MISPSPSQPKTVWPSEYLPHPHAQVHNLSTAEGASPRYPSDDTFPGAFAPTPPSFSPGRLSTGGFYAPVPGYDQTPQPSYARPQISPSPSYQYHPALYYPPPTAAPPRAYVPPLSLPEASPRTFSPVPFRQMPSPLVSIFKQDPVTGQFQAAPTTSSLDDLQDYRPDISEAPRPRVIADTTAESFNYLLHIRLRNLRKKYPSTSSDEEFFPAMIEEVNKLLNEFGASPGMPTGAPQFSPFPTTTNIRQKDIPLALDLLVSAQHYIQSGAIYEDRGFRPNTPPAVATAPAGGEAFEAPSGPSFADITVEPAHNRRR